MSGIQVPQSQSSAVEQSRAARPLQKNPTLKGKASGFFAKLKPQLNVDTSTALSRKFSFEAGDDANASLSAPPIDTLPAAVRERLIRKSASMSSLELTYNRAAVQETTLSPVAQSPTNSAPAEEVMQTPPDYDESKRPSRIPTPAYKTG